MNSLTTALSRFFAWWLGELAACIPGRLRTLIAHKPSILVITPINDAAQLSVLRRGRVRPLGELPIAPGGESRGALSGLLDGSLLRRLDVAVNVPAGNVLRRRVTLPIEAVENLREVLAFEMDRHTPFKASEVAYDYRVLATDTATRKLTVDLAVVPRGMLERAASIAESFGLTANRIGIADADLQQDKPFNFRPYDSSDRAAIERPLLLALTVTTAILAAIAWYLPLYFDHRASAAYETRLDETRAAALQAEHLKKRLTATMDLSRFLTERRAATPTVTSLLADVTDRLPDETWLTQLQWQNDKLTLTGFSPSAASLIAKLEPSPLLTDVRFGSPVTPDAQVGRESFNILARVAMDPGS